jgi:hypothetical protein
MKKFRVFIDMEKEEQYLKQLAEQGWGLVKYSSLNIYTFEKITPQTLNYKIDYRDFKNKAAYSEYLTLFEDSGWRHISGSKNSGIHIFLPLDSQAQAMDIFSDNTSRNERYKHLYNHALSYGTLMLIYLVLFQSSWPSWYLQESLWSSYSGLQLVGMIVMETFFLFIQAMPLLFFLAAAIYYVIVGMNAQKYLKDDQIAE